MQGRTTNVIVVAAAVVAVIVTAILAPSFSGAGKTITSTVTTTQTSVVTKTLLVNKSSSSSSSNSGIQRVYKLTFQESGECSPPEFLSAWSVTLENQWTEAEPSNASLPISDTYFMGSPQFVNQSTITFSVSDGTYSYSIRPENMLGASSGNVTVRGADVIVEVNGPFFTCRSSTSSSP